MMETEKKGGQFMDGKKKLMAAVGIAAAAIALAAGIYFYTQSPYWTAGKGAGSATGSSALKAVGEAYGGSKVESLADLAGKPENADALDYLAENSLFVLDIQYVTERAEAEYLEMESKAMASGQSYEEYVAEACGGKSVAEYEEERYEAYSESLRQRLVAYEVAKRRHITISKKEYEERLPGLAEKFGYGDDTDLFESECDRDSIAVEMLFEKTKEWLANQ